MHRRVASCHGLTGYFHFILSFLYFYFVLPINMYTILILTIRFQVMQSGRWGTIIQEEHNCVGCSWRQYVHQEHWYLPTRLHVMKQQTKILVLILTVLYIIIVMVHMHGPADQASLLRKLNMFARPVELGDVNSHIPTL